MANDVQFRRIHGRIIPIKINPQQKQGAGLVGSGIVVGTAAGLGAAHLHHEAARVENIARGAQVIAKKTLDAAGRIKASKAINENFKRASALYNRGRRIRSAGGVVAAGLIGAGVTKLLPEKTKEKVKHNAAVAGAVGVATAALTAFAVRNPYYAALSNRKILGGAAEAFRKIKLGFKV